MTKCLNERALLKIYTNEAFASERTHLRSCADCAERYDELVEDVESIKQVLEMPPPTAEVRESWSFQRWVPVAACMAVVLLVFSVTWLRRPSPNADAARTSNVSAFATDLSAALFTMADARAVSLNDEAPYLTAALEAGQPCTRGDFFAGECNDQLSALVTEND